MKELSTEEKAQAYDKAREKIAVRFGTNVAEEIFSEFEESEDEKIRKGLINGFNECLKNSQYSNNAQKYWHNIKIEDIFAWLEKQGKQKSIWHNEDEEPKRDSLILLIMQSGTPIVAKIIEPNHTFNHGERWAYIDDLLEKQGIEKLTVKPKFKVGDWIIYSNEEVHLITGFADNGYFVDKECYIPFNCEGNMRLWTIQDAKDGDVLCINYGGPKPFIFSKNNCYHAYCALNSFGEFILEPAEWLIKTNVSPATKEQRELLFQKMKESGYEWLEETKELKKIEQKPTQVIKPFEAEHGKYYYCIKDYFCGGRKQASKGDVVQALRGLPIMGLKDASEYFMPVNFINCNSAWSEKDEKEYKYVLRFVDNILNNCGNKKDYEHCKRCYDWLKSLKQRIEG